MRFAIPALLLLLTEAVEAHNIEEKNAALRLGEARPRNARGCFRQLCGCGAGTR